MVILQHNQLVKCKIYTGIILYYIFYQRGGIIMLKLLSKIAEKYAKATNTACMAFLVFHQPKMPASMIKKD